MKKILSLILVFLLITIIIFLPSSSTKNIIGQNNVFNNINKNLTVQNNDIYRNIANFGSIAYLKNCKCRQFSSYNRSGSNCDRNNFLRKEPDGKFVLADMYGPGGITRIWVTGDEENLENGLIQIFFDNETEPTVNCSIIDLFGLGDFEPFVPPLANYSSGGFYCYLPMPYLESCCVKVKDCGIPFYYHVTYLTFNSSDGVHTFTLPMNKSDKNYLSKIIDMWENCGKDPNGYDAELERIEGEKNLLPFRTTTIADIADTGIIHRIWINFKAYRHRFVNKIDLKMYWDDEKTPSIYSPLGAFFGDGFRNCKYSALPIGIASEGYYCYFPMPFNNSAKIKLKNNNLRLIKISYIIEYKKTDFLPTDIGRFHAKWNADKLTPRDGNYKILETSGKGHFVGCQMYMKGYLFLNLLKNLHVLNFLEGDEMIYVDGEDFPSIYGTGTEDYFNSGFYFYDGTISHPLHGCTLIKLVQGKVSAYRFHINDFISFDSSIKITIEHGPENSIRTNYASVAYWYASCTNDFESNNF